MMTKNFLAFIYMACLMWAAASCGMVNEQGPIPSASEEPIENPVSQTGDSEKAVVVPNQDGSLEDPMIIIMKSDRILELYSDDLLIGSYCIALGREPAGDKQKEGDGRTPEGSYFICTRNEQSRYYLSLGVSYPNEEDAAEALQNGMIDNETYNKITEAADTRSKPPWDTPMGGEIMIHGMGSRKDWTMGCIAVENDVMDILWQYCPLGTPIIIKP